MLIRNITLCAIASLALATCAMPRDAGEGISYLLDWRDIKRARYEFEREMAYLERIAQERIRAALNPTRFNPNGELSELRIDVREFRRAQFIPLKQVDSGVQRGSFKVDANWHGGRCILLFRAPRYRTMVKVNGVKIGEHIGKSPFEMDITRWIKWDAVNDLEVIAIDIRGKRVRCRYPKFIMIRSPTYLRMVLITPSVKWRRLSVAVTVDSPMEFQNLTNWRIKCIVTDLNFARAYGMAMAIPKRVGEPIRINIPARQLKHWSPEEPNLYILRCVLIDENGKVRDIYDARFGYREFEVRGGHFYLNGKRIFLRGSYPSAMMPPNVWRETVDSDEPSKRERWLKWVWHCINAYKVAHLNTFYMHPDVCPYSDELLDAFDEAGMLVLSFPFAPYANYEDATWDIERAPVPLRDLQRQAMELFLRDWNHPCIIIYAFDGEGMDCYLREGNLEAYRRAQRYFRQFMHFVRRANPSRIHSDSCGDRNFTGLSQVYDEHFYAGYYHSSVPDFVNRCIPRYYFKRESHNRKIPIIFSEMCGCYTHSGRKGGFSNELVASSWVGTFASNPIVARVYQAWNYKHTIEGCRRLQVDGIFPFAYCVGFYGPRGTYSDPAPAAICVRIAMEPVLVSFGTFDQRFYDGDICEFPIWVVNDTNARIHNARLRWSIESANGEVIKRGEKVLDIAPCSSECVLRVKWRIQLHEARSSHQKRNIANRIAVPSWMHRTPHSVSEGEWKPIIHVVRAELVNESGEVLSFNSHPFLIYTRERDTVEQHNVRVWLYDPVGDTEAVLRKLGIRFKRYAGGNLRNADLLIIGANGSNDGLTEHAHEIRHFAESDAGGVVLILEHSDLERLSWLTNARRNPFANFTGIVPDTVGYFRYNFAHIVRRGHLIFNGLGEWDFNLWNGFNGTIHAGDGMLNAIDMSMEGWDVLAVTSLETGACLVEKVGWIYSQFLAIERFGKDPIATRYLCNLLNYALMRAREKATWAQSVRTAEAWLKRNGHITGDHTNIELIVSHRLFWHVRRRSSAGIGKYRGIAFKFREPIRSIQFNYWFATAQQRLQLQLVSDDGRVMWQSDGDVNVGTVKLSGLNVRGFELRACHTKAILYPTFFAEVWNLHINGSTRSE